MITPLEFGCDPSSKIDLGLLIAEPLLSKIHHDLLWWKQPALAKHLPEYEEEGEPWFGIDNTNLQN